jgi:hypothetical protein
MAGEAEFSTPARSLTDLLKRDAQRASVLVGKTLVAVTSDDLPDPSLKLWFDDGSTLIIFESSGRGWLSSKIITQERTDKPKLVPT